MEKLNQKQIIIEHLKEINDWLPCYELIKVNTKYGWLGIQSGRRARELANEGKILRKQEGKYVYYKIKPPLKYENYRADGEIVYRKPIYA